MNLESLAKTQEVFEFDLDEDCVFKIESLSAEQVTTFEMFLNGNAKGVLNDVQKVDFCRNNIKGWSGIQFEGSNFEFSDTNKLIFAKKEYATVLMAMVTAAYSRYLDIEKKIDEDIATAKK